MYGHNCVDSTQETVFEFLDVWHAAEVALGHTPREMRVDAVPNLNTPGLSQPNVLDATSSSCPKQLEGTMNMSHASNVPKTNSLATRMHRTSGQTPPVCNTTYDAALYSMFRRNFRCKSDETKSRVHIHTSKPSDFTRHPPYLFMCPVETLKIHHVTLGEERTEQGVIIGMTSEGKYHIYKDNGKAIIRRDVKPIGEYQMALRGMPPSSVQVDWQETQTEATDVQQPQSLPAPALQAQVPLGQDRQLRSHAQPQAAPPPPAPAKDTRHSPRLASASGASAAIAAAIEAYPESEHVQMFHDLVYQHHGDSVAVECSSLEQLDDARVSLLVAETALIDGHEISSAEFIAACSILSADATSRLEVSKASQTHDVYVKTDSGGYSIHVPQTKVEHSKSPQKDQWKISHGKAHMTIISDPRNYMIKKKTAKEMGGVIAPCVMEDKIKIDKANGHLQEYKSRLCYAQNVVDRVRKKMNKLEYHRLYNSDSDDLSLPSSLGHSLYWSS